MEEKEAAIVLAAERRTDTRFRCPVCGVKLPRYAHEVWTEEQMRCKGPNEAEYRRKEEAEPVR